MNQKLKVVEELLGDTFPNLLERHDNNCAAIARAANKEAKSREFSFTITARMLRNYRIEMSAQGQGLAPALTRGARQTCTEADRELYNHISQILNEMSTEREPEERVPITANGTESVVVLLGDWHIGKVCEREGRTLYNTEIATRRLRRFGERLNELLQGYIDIEAHDIDDLHLLLLGDLVDSEIVYETQAHFIEIPVIKQVSEAAGALVALIRSQRRRFKNIHVWTVGGNHGMTDKMHYASNWDNVVYKMAELATKDLDNINWNITFDNYNLAKVRDWRFLLRHGRGLPRGENTPSYRAKMGGWHAIHGYDAVAVGHWHHAKVGNWNGHKVFYNGTLVSGDDLTERLAFADEPCQIVFGVSDARPCTFLYFVDLRD